MVKMAVLSRPHRWSNQKDFNNFSCHRLEELPHQITWHSGQICRRSSLKCVACPILSFPFTRRGRFDCGWISAYEWLQGETLIIHVQFDADWTMYSGVIRIWIFLAKRSKWRPRHAQTVTLIRKILITFDPKGVKSTPSDFHEDTIKSLGGVR